MNGLDPANVLKCWPRDESYLVGVSGGRDSVTLLHLLVKELAYPDLTVVHVDHQLRAESSEDALFVADLAKQLECPSVVRPIDVKTMASTWKCSIETAARRARHEVFAEIRAEKKAGGVFLGHHADDQVETILFRLFRGSGVSGLGGMREDTTIEIGGKALRLMRPLLRCWRSEIDQYVEANKIVFREDRSNAKPDHLRNRIRHQLIPEINRTFARDVRSAIQRAGEIWMEEDQYLAGLIGEKGGDEELSVNEVKRLPVALRRRVVHQWLVGQGVGGVGFEEVGRVLSLIAENAAVAKINLPGGRHARRRAGRLFLE